MSGFRALVVNNGEDGFSIGIRQLELDDLPQGDLLIRVAYSSVNYKDGLACSPNGNVVRSYPFVPGIDLAGIVEHSADPRFKAGDEVIVTSYELGVSHYGGFSEYARVPAAWAVPLPEGLTLMEAMIFGTAGFTAALSIQRLEENGLRKENGPVLVSGSTGGVGSFAVAMLAKLGYEVVASTGKASEHDYLYRLGASEIVSREQLNPDKIRPLDKQRWAGAVDPVGGRMLAYILSTMKYGGSAAVSGLTGGSDFSASVFPFILRGVNLLGIDSVYCPMPTRLRLWERLGSDFKPEPVLREVAYVIRMEDLPPVLDDILQGKIRGRTVVAL